MSGNFFDFLTARVRSADSLLCVGLDPRADSVEELRAECGRIIDATAESAAAFKPNSAFFEAHGPEGMLALLDVIAYVPNGIPVVLDAKRGDIADTAEAYAQAAFDTLGAHALTVSPYLGGAALAPFLARPEYGVFILCKTSNPGADEFQALTLTSGPSPSKRGESGATLFELVAERAQQWNTNGNVGLVVGATYPDALARVRALAPDLWFLVPGVGAQGGDLAATLAAGLRTDGLGLLVNASRAVARAINPGAEAKRLRDEINRHRRLEVRSWKLEHPSPISVLARDLLASGCVRFGQFTLRSGQSSPIYLDLRRLVSHPAILRRAARAYAAKLSTIKFDRLAGLPYAALPIGTAIALEIDRPLIYPRRETKDYGTKAAIEGDFAPGERVAVIDDLATTGDTKLEAIQKLEAAGLVVRDIVVLIDREQGAKEILAAAGYTFHAVATLRELLDEWRRAGAITEAQYAEAQEYLTR